MFDLAGKRAIVTGSTKGIGRAIAEAFARAGAKVVISSRKPDACDKVAGEIADDGGEVNVDLLGFVAGQQDYVSRHCRIFVQ